MHTVVTGVPVTNRKDDNGVEVFMKTARSCCVDGRRDDLCYSLKLVLRGR